MIRITFDDRKLVSTICPTKPLVPITFWPIYIPCFLPLSITTILLIGLAELLITLTIVCFFDVVLDSSVILRNRIFSPFSEANS